MDSIWRAREKATSKRASVNATTNELAAGQRTRTVVFLLRPLNLPVKWDYSSPNESLRPLVLSDIQPPLRFFAGKKV